MKCQIIRCQEDAVVEQQVPGPSLKVCNKHQRETKEPGLTHQQLGLIWMSAFAFNMGIGAREDHDTTELDAALRAMKLLFNITVES